MKRYYKYMLIIALVVNPGFVNSEVEGDVQEEGIGDRFKQGMKNIHTRVQLAVEHLRRSMGKESKKKAKQHIVSAHQEATGLGLSPVKTAKSLLSSLGKIHKVNDHIKDWFKEQVYQLTYGDDFSEARNMLYQDYQKKRAALIRRHQLDKDAKDKLSTEELYDELAVVNESYQSSLKELNKFIKEKSEAGIATIHRVAKGVDWLVGPEPTVIQKSTKQAAQEAIDTGKVEQPPESKAEGIIKEVIDDAVAGKPVAGKIAGHIAKETGQKIKETVETAASKVAATSVAKKTGQAVGYVGSKVEEGLTTAGVLPTGEDIVGGGRWDEPVPERQLGVTESKVVEPVVTVAKKGAQVFDDLGEAQMADAQHQVEAQKEMVADFKQAVVYPLMQKAIPSGEDIVGGGRWDEPVTDEKPVDDKKSKNDKWFWQRWKDKFVPSASDLRNVFD